MENRISEQERDNRIDTLYKEKSELLEKYGVFGGGHLVNAMHRNINEELEELGVPESGHKMPYSEWINS